MYEESDSESWCRVCKPVSVSKGTFDQMQQDLETLSHQIVRLVKEGKGDIHKESPVYRAAQRYCKGDK